VAQAFIRVKCNGYLTKNQHDWVGLGKTMRAANFNTRPVTPKRWQDLEAIFNSKGCSMARGCWCMYYRKSGEQPAPPTGSTISDVIEMGLEH
jgi:hypothetical protein